MDQERLSAVRSNFVPYNNVPMGATHVKGKLIMTIPRRNPGIPATLSYISTKSPKGSSPSFRAFPSYRMNELHVRMNTTKRITEFCVQNFTFFSRKICQIITELYRCTGHVWMPATDYGSSIQALWNTVRHFQNTMLHEL